MERILPSGKVTWISEDCLSKFPARETSLRNPNFFWIFHVSRSNIICIGAMQQKTLTKASFPDKYIALQHKKGKQNV